MLLSYLKLLVVIVGSGGAIPSLNYVKADTMIVTDSAVKTLVPSTNTDTAKPAKAVFAHYMVSFHYSLTGVDNEAHVGRLEPSLKITLDKTFRVLMIWEYVRCCLM